MNPIIEYPDYNSSNGFNFDIRLIKYSEYYYYPEFGQDGYNICYGVGLHGDDWFMGIQGIFIL